MLVGEGLTTMSYRGQGVMWAGEGWGTIWEGKETYSTIQDF